MDMFISTLNKRRETTAPWCTPLEREKFTELLLFQDNALDSVMSLSYDFQDSEYNIMNVCFVIAVNITITIIIFHDCYYYYNNINTLLLS